MKCVAALGSLASAPTDVVRVVFVGKGEATRVIKEGRFETLQIPLPSEKPTLRELRLLARVIIETAKTQKIRRLGLELTTAYLGALGLPPEECIQQIVENAVMADFEFTRFKTKPKEGYGGVETVTIYTDSRAMAAAVKKGVVVGEAVNECRELANMPGGDMTPTRLARAAQEAVRNLPVTVTILDEAKIRKEGMGALLGVAKGSSEKPTFTILDYRGGKGAPIVLAGKGVTFDSGGLNVKPEAGMYEMHMDMAGAAAVISTIALIARLKINRRVIGLIPAAENMSGGSAYRPGDILRSLSGKTIEVLNTDAEGRLVLADALTYAKRFKPAAVIDLATLTGAALVALGQHANALLTRDDALAATLLQSSEASGDYLWRLPLWDEYEDAVQSAFADVANVPGNGPSSRYGGAINGGMFLWQFAKELGAPWAHIDIAPRMTTLPNEHLAKGASGTGVRLLLHYIEQCP